MDERSINIRIPRRWLRLGMILGAAALVAAPISALASHTFTDVPSNHTFHSDIAWLADAGVTKGCNPPANTQFCPNDNVTRGQMGAFMRRFAQYLGAEDGTPDQATNASKLNGLTASQLAPRASFNSDENGDGTGAQPHKISTQITAPARGILVMNGSMLTYHGGFEDSTTCWLELNNDKVHGSETKSSPGENNDDGCNASGAAVVSAGAHTVDLTASGPLWYWDENVWVMWVPFDGLGNTP